MTRDGLLAMLDYVRSDAHALQLIRDNGLVDTLVSTVASAISTVAAA
jgi:hypothetical protein